MNKLDEGIWQVKNLLSPDDCAVLILQAEIAGFQVARMRNTGRNNREVFLYCHEAVKAISTRLHECVSEKFQVAGLGQSLECYRYQEDEFVAPHRDTSRKISSNIWSNMTLVIYLNNDFEGGETCFSQSEIKVTPELGKAVLFEHSILHEGAKVFKGLKYIIRADTALFDRYV